VELSPLNPRRERRASFNTHVDQTTTPLPIPLTPRLSSQPPTGPGGTSVIPSLPPLSPWQVGCWPRRSLIGGCGGLAASPWSTPREQALPPLPQVSRLVDAENLD
jgi:hypothetical protein